MRKEKSVLDNYKKLINEAIEELKTPEKRYRQIPNILTVLRLFAPLLIIPSAITGNIPLTIGLAAGFGLTDLADGFIARHWKLTSELGKDLDALADKLFSGTLLLAASVLNPLLLMNVGLEMAIAGVNIYQKANGKETASTMMGKIKTWSLFTLAGLGIAVPVAAETGVLNLLSITTAALQGLTINSYVKQYNKSNDNKDNTPPPKTTKRKIGQITEANVKENTKVLEKEEYTESSAKEQPTKTDDEFLEELKKMSEFLHQEQQNQLNDSNEQTVNLDAIQKVKSSGRN